MSVLQLELRDENQRYRTYLEQRQLDEQKQQVELDRILQLELDRQNAKRLEKTRAEQDKRARLLQGVIEGRQQQLVERRKMECSCRSRSFLCSSRNHFADERKAEETNAYQWQKDNIKHITEQGQLEDAQREAQNKAKRATYRQDLLGQMSYEQRRMQQVR